MSRKKFTWDYASSYEWAEPGKVFFGHISGQRFPSVETAVADAKKRGSVSINGAIIFRRLKNGAGWMHVTDVFPVYEEDFEELC